jgi:NNP family nitrate/nitrite transporter-like MFS transporter
MGLIAVAMLFGFFFVKSFNDLLAMGVLLGIAGASFGVALSLGAGSFPARHKGMAMGLVGAGNVGTALSVLIAPPLAQAFGWVAVYGLAALAISLPMLVMVLFAKEPDDLDQHAGFREHIACLFEKDGWAFSLIYAVTFGGYRPGDFLADLLSRPVRCEQGTSWSAHDARRIHGRCATGVWGVDF